MLVERLLNIVESEGTDIDRFLVITFTRAAAEELRGRILERLYQRLAQQPGSAHLRRQTALVYRAQISTIHGFCGAILRENAQLCGIRADFRQLDDTEAEVIKGEVLDGVLAERYREMTDGFRALADTLGAGRDDSALVKTVKDCYEAVQGHPYPEKWLGQRIAEPVFGGDAGETLWGKLLLRRAADRCAFWLRRTEQALSLVMADSDAASAYGPSFGETAASIKNFLDAVREGWDSACRCEEPVFPRLKPLKNIGPEIERARLIREKCKKAMSSLKKVFDTDSAGHREDLEAVKPCTDELFRLVIDFSAAYGEEKKKRGALDFNDLEHMALRLLTDENGEPNEQARQIAARYREVLVDEYQDCNRVQDAIFSAVCGNGNITMVGDVKQSIYRFRLADPSIFLEKYTRFSDVPSPEGRRIVLADNFRSDKGVIDAVNGLFGLIMTRGLGELDYAGREELRCRAPEKAEGAGAQFELHLLETDGDRLSDEAGYTAGLIDRLLSSGITIEGRALRPEDIAILLRAAKGKEKIYAEALERRGIEARSQRAEEDISERKEVLCALSILQITDNPRQDIPLIAALRSPVWGFTAHELPEIRAAKKDGCFYDALTAAAGEEGAGETSCREKCASFLELLEDFRLCASDMPTDRLLGYIYEKTMLPAIAEAETPGSSEGLYALLDYARSYERSGYRGLFSFVKQIREAAENGGVKLPGSGGGSRGVLISSVHNSKGLEYPVAVLAGLSSQFNKADLRKPLLIHPELGAGSKRTDRRRGIEYPTLPKLAIAAQTDNELLSEEMRILYVAMTRAKHKLLAICSASDADGALSSAAATAEGGAEYQELESSRSPAVWLLTAASALGWPIIRAAAGDDTEAESAKTEARGPVFSNELAEKIKQSLVWSYERITDTRLPSKLTATELKGGAAAAEAAEEAESLPPSRKAGTLRRPAFISESRGLTPAERGTALHLVMQYIDYGRCGSAEEIEAEKERLLTERMITPQQAEAATAEKILAFFASPLGRRVLKADKITREFKFSLLVPASEYYPDGKGKILLQGVVDCFIEEAGELSVIDFKTDRIREDRLEERAAAYRPQLAAYASALERITGKKVKQRLVYFFSVGKYTEI
ncbi:MAG: UvrD-helicase domain-containing protein [Oscillospiraceae bacterium]|nr:UvrD-helicase domain-containing protein [Oscillospiraceae bacterium]